MSNQTNAPPTLRQKAAVITKLADAGCVTDSALKKLALKDMLAIKGITISEIRIISEIQEAAASGGLFTYLAEKPPGSATALEARDGALAGKAEQGILKGGQENGTETPGFIY